MLRSHFLAACRSLVRNKVFSLINIIGLSVGLMAFVVMLLYVRFELSYDDFHRNSENIYRIVTKVTLQDEEINHEKEIGIRKVLGASVSNIIALFSSDFS